MVYIADPAHLHMSGQNLNQSYDRRNKKMEIKHGIAEGTNQECKGREKRIKEKKIRDIRL